MQEDIRWFYAISLIVLQNAKQHREKELKKAEDEMTKAKQRAENSMKEFKAKEQVLLYFIALLIFSQKTCLGNFDNKLFFSIKLAWKNINFYCVEKIYFVK